MIVFKDTKGFQTRNDKPNENWTILDVYIVEDGSELANKIMENYPHYDFVLSDGALVDITPTERPEPEPEEMSEVEVLADYVMEVDFRVLMIEMGL